MEEKKLTLVQKEKNVRRVDGDEFDRHRDERLRNLPKQEKKAQEIVALLRRYIPDEHLPEVERFIAMESFIVWNALRRYYSMMALRKHVPVEHWHEIEGYLDNVSWTERVMAATRAAQKDGWSSPIGMLPAHLRLAADTYP
jgi:hypothetical protein